MDEDHEKSKSIGILTETKWKELICAGGPKKIQRKKKIPVKYEVTI